MGKLFNDISLRELVARMKQMSYCPGQVRQVFIPKGVKPGVTRPLGISNLEDKIVQKMVVLQKKAKNRLVVVRFNIYVDIIGYIPQTI
jgi:retron-type reverse transcriptase